MKKRWMTAILLLFVFAGCVCLHVGYDAQQSALDAMTRGEKRGNMTAFMPEDTKAGLIFYPGGLVDHAAYAALMEALAAKGVLCLLVQMPFDLAVFDADAARGLTHAYPEVDRWIIGGHSLGGAMAADFAAKEPQHFEGLLLLGAYSTADLSATGLRVLSIYGTQDGVLNREKYKACRENYPEDFEEVLLEGGNHAQFGCYGRQRGDGEAAIAQEEQWEKTAQAVSQWLGL